MLVLSRKVGESIKIGDGITIVVNRISGNRVTLGLEAPREMRIVRGELKPFADAFVDRPEVTFVDRPEVSGQAPPQPEVQCTVPRAIAIEANDLSYLTRRAR